MRAGKYSHFFCESITRACHSLEIQEKASLLIAAFTDFARNQGAGVIPTLDKPSFALQT
jgi:hypothetical protein